MTAPRQSLQMNVAIQGSLNDAVAALEIANDLATLADDDRLSEIAGLLFVARKLVKDPI